MKSKQSNFDLVGKKYSENSFNKLYTKSITDIRIFDFISTARFFIPSLSINECCKAFLKKEKIDEGDLNIAEMTKTYLRIQKELFEEKKTKNS